MTTTTTTTTNNFRSKHVALKVLTLVLVFVCTPQGACARPIDSLNIARRQHIDEAVADAFNKDIRDALKDNPHGLLFWEVEESRGTLRRRLNPDTDKQVNHVAQFIVDEMNRRSLSLGGVVCELAHVLNPCLYMERGGNALYRFRFQIAVVSKDDRLRHVLRSYEATVHEDATAKLVVMAERMVDSDNYVDGWMGRDGVVHAGGVQDHASDDL